MEQEQQRQRQVEISYGESSRRDVGTVSPQEYIDELEIYLALGDVEGASKAFARIYDCWKEFDDATQKDLKLLEEIYLSLVKIRGANQSTQ